MLVIEQLSKVFGDLTAVDSVSLAIPKGQMVGVIGRSGAGKSTLLRMVNRLTDPSHGTIINEDQDITALRGRRSAPLARVLRDDLPAVQSC